MNHQSADVIIIGAGAAGLMCAIEAGKRGRSVIVIERNPVVGKKIRISGGGRCNFTNLYVSPEHFVSQNRSFHKSALARYTPADFVALVERHGIAYHEKKLGQLFCDGSAQQIIDMLLEECDGAGVEVVVNCAIENVQKPGRFVLTTSLGEFDCESLVVATGGVSIPKLGVTYLGYSIAREFGIGVVGIQPGLVPLTLDFNDPLLQPFRQLHGVSLDAEVKWGPFKFRENVLFTHRGLSGPAILQISNYWKRMTPITIEVLSRPRRFMQAWKTLYAPDVQRWIVAPSGTEGYEKAEVTLGGVDTRELSSRTMESKRVPGLYFIGEVVDVTGRLGGFNFQWAWASGYVAGQAV